MDTNENNINEYGIKDLTLAYITKKSKIYQAGGYKEAKSLKRSREDYTSHFFAFLVDMNICLLPVYLWVIEFLLIITGLIPPHFFDLLFYIMFALLFVTSVVVLPVFTARGKGQSLGYFYMGLKLVGNNNREANGLYLILRQVLGFGIPVMVLGYFFQVPGILLWWLLNGIVVLVMPNQQTLVDIFLRLHLVRDPNTKIVFESQVRKKEKVQTQNTEDITPIDLHIRSNYSDDGCYDVEEVFKQAKEIGLETISITDHNCARQNSAAQPFASLYGIQYIPGIEVDAQYNDTRVRILGYYIDWNNPVFETIEQDSLKREKDLSIERVRKFEEYTGVTIDVDAILANSRFKTITASDITTMVFNNEKVRQLPFVRQYIDSTNSKQQAMRAFKFNTFGKDGPCYVKANYPRCVDVIHAIHDAGGIAVLASWHMDYTTDEEIEQIIGLGIDGIECFCPGVHSETIAVLLKMAQQHKLLISCGSDFHGPTKKNHHLGVTCCPEKAIPLVKIITKAVN